MYLRCPRAVLSTYRGPLCTQAPVSVGPGVVFTRLPFTGDGLSMMDSQLALEEAHAAAQDRDLQKPRRPLPTPKGRIGLIVAASLATGLVAALALVAAPFVPAKENFLTGVVLLGFAFGWALLVVLSVRFTNQPQRWAAAVSYTHLTLPTTPYV